MGSRGHGALVRMRHLGPRIADSAGLGRRAPAAPCSLATTQHP